MSGELSGWFGDRGSWRRAAWAIIGALLLAAVIAAAAIVATS